jgi:hypothetical protein
MDSEYNDLMDIKIKFGKKSKTIKRVIKSKSNTKRAKKFPRFIFYLLCFIFLIFLVYAFLFKIDITITAKNKKELTNKNDMNIDNKLKMLRIITNNNIKKYEGVEKCLLNDPDNELCIYHLIAPKKVIGKERILLGEKKDGCYVILNDFKDIKIAYSFGIDKIIQFDKALADRGIDIYMYDHTINSLPYNNPKFHWEKIGICGRNNETDQLKTLEYLLNKNGHTSEKNMILKMDIEGSEWESLKDVSEDVLKQFKYIIIEYHFLSDNVELYYNIIRKIYKNHQAFYVRCHGREKVAQFGNNMICLYLEVSYVIREGNHFDKDDSIYPNYEFDFTGPNEKAGFEINLNILKLFYN